MAKNWFTPEQPRTTPHGKVVGELVFARRDAKVGSEAGRLLDQLVEILETHTKGIEPSKLLLLGDTDAHDSPKRDPELAKRRAQAVKDYVLRQLSNAKHSVVTMEVAGKGVAMPGRPSSQADRRPIVEIINRGLPLKKAGPPVQKAASLDEALATAMRAMGQIDQTKHPNASTRIGHWVFGIGRNSLAGGNKRDGYLHHMDPMVQRQAAGQKLSPAEFEKLLDRHRIVNKLMEVGSKDSPLVDVAQQLVTIDGGILGGIDYLLERAGRVVASTSNSGLAQMIRYILSKPDDWRPPNYPWSRVRHDDTFSFYWIYFQKLGD